jgi:hypothetical protein
MICIALCIKYLDQSHKDVSGESTLVSFIQQYNAIVFEKGITHRLS